MRPTLLLLVALAALSGCAMDRNRNSSEREWQRAECDRIIDRDARERCLKRLDNDYGSLETKEVKDPKARK
jgi:hypothetical protein